MIFPFCSSFVASELQISFSIEHVFSYCTREKKHSSDTGLDHLVYLHDCKVA